MGTINFAGNDGTNFRTGASIVATNDQGIDWSTADCPTRLVFSTTVAGAASPTERMRIKSGGDVSIVTGNLIIGTAGKGIDFSAGVNAAGMTSELLDDYERGTFTPSLINAGSPSYSTASGEYTKIGSSVWINFILTWSGATTSSNVRIGGFPFAMTDSATKVRGLATSDVTGTTVYTLETTGLSNSALYYHPAISNTSGTIRATIQITTL
jgi:hypothetical protein